MSRHAVTFDENTARVEEELEAGNSWSAVDITSILDGSYRPALPTVGRRADGVGLLYPGRIHTVASESEAGKTWLGLVICRDELADGNNVIYIDFEDDEGGVVSRLLTVGATRAQIAAGFRYVRPEEPLMTGGGKGWQNIADILEADLPTLCILDGVTEAMALHGLEMKDNTDVAKFGKMLPRRIADQGPAVCALDHVTKAADGRGRYAIGAVHKLNGVNGAAYVLENRKAFGVGQKGKSGLFIAKDRPGQLRRHALPSREGLHWFADLVVDSKTETDAFCDLFAPIENDSLENRNTKLMIAISNLLAGAGRDLSGREIEDRITGKGTEIRAAASALVDEGYIEFVKGPRNANLHKLKKEFVDVGI